MWSRGENRLFSPRDFWGPATANIVDVPSENYFGLVLGSCPRTLRSTGGVARPEELLAGKLL